MRSKQFISVVVLSILMHAELVAATPVNLNVKSGLLSRLFGNPSSNESGPKDYHDSSTTTASAEREKGKVSLDLSGTYHCLVAGPTQTEGAQGEMIPLFQTGTLQKGWSPPSLILSARYNFSKAWYGATRLMTNLQWSYRKSDNGNASGTPLTVNLQAEKGLSGPNDYAAQLRLSLKASANKNPPSLELRWEPSCPQVTVSAPLTQRVNVVWRSIFPSTRANVLTSRPSFPSKTKDWWVPNLKINTAGRLTTDNQVSFQTNQNTRHVGVRLLLSRQLGWSAFGGSGGFIDDHLGTTLTLELAGADNGGESFSKLTMQSVLEHPLDSTRLTLSHEQVHKW